MRCLSKLTKPKLIDEGLQQTSMTAAQMAGMTVFQLRQVLKYDRKRQLRQVLKYDRKRTRVKDKRVKDRKAATGRDKTVKDPTVKDMKGPTIMDRTVKDTIVKDRRVEADKGKKGATDKDKKKTLKDTKAVKDRKTGYEPHFSLFLAVNSKDVAACDRRREVPRRLVGNRSYIGLRVSPDEAMIRAHKISWAPVGNSNHHVILQVDFSAAGFLHYATLSAGSEHNFEPVLAKTVYRKDAENDWNVWHFNMDMPLEKYGPDGQVWISSIRPSVE
jgi:hypothetical protein